MQFRTPFVRSLQSLFLAVGASVGLSGPVSAQAPEFSVEAGRSLKELERLCAAESGRLWRRSLCGPTLIVDPATRRYVAQDFAQSESSEGILDPAVPVANTAIDWNDKRWAMIIWPLPQERRARARLMLHESWHRLQRDLGLSMADRPRDHLGTVEGRSSIRLEMRALSQAMATTKTAAMRRSACDALAIRAARYRSFREAAAGEAALERNEGLAEYTGWAAAGPIDRLGLSAALAEHDRGAEFGRNFAYATGPAYGVLLDRFRPRWREQLAAEADLGTMLLSALGPVCASEKQYVRAAAKFGMDRIAADERAVAEKRAAREADWRSRLIEGAKATFPMTNANIVFDPNQVVALPPEGDVHPAAEVTAAWGKLVARDGLLLARDWSRVVVSGRNVQVGNREATGDGWKLMLAPGWQLSRVDANDWAVRVVFTPDMRSSRR